MVAGCLTVALHTKRTVRPGEELTIDYNTVTDRYAKVCGLRFSPRMPPPHDAS